jgi:hypothetical protein
MAVLRPDGHPLPCDVLLPPCTLIRAGCSLSTLLGALKRRQGEDVSFNARAVKIGTADTELDANIRASMKDDELRETNAYLRAALTALREVYRLAGEDPQIAAACNRVLDQGWARL